MEINHTTAKVLWEILKKLPEVEENIQVKSDIINYLHNYQRCEVVRLKDKQEELEYLKKSLGE